MQLLQSATSSHLRRESLRAEPGICLSSRARDGRIDRGAALSNTGRLFSLQGFDIPTREFGFSSATFALLPLPFALRLLVGGLLPL